MTSKKSDFQQLTDKIIQFRDARDWKQFHNPKDLSISLALEAAEIMEHFQWKTSEEIQQHIQKNKTALGEEIADVMIYLIQLADITHIDLIAASYDKLTKVGKKYPLDKIKGKHTNKYNPKP